MNWYKRAYNSEKFLILAKSPATPDRLVDTILEEVKKFKQDNSEETKTVKIPIDLTDWVYGGNELLDDRYESQTLDWTKALPPEKLAELYGISVEELPDYLENFRKSSSYELKLIIFKHPLDPSKRGPKTTIGHPTREQPANYMGALKRMNVWAGAPRDLLRSVIEHELIHYAQYLFKDIKKSIGFLPPKKIRDQENPDKEYQGHESFKSHVLSDMEFYPNLMFIEAKIDKKMKEIESRYERFGEERVKREKLKIIKENVIDPKRNENDMFYVLKKYSPEKWKKIVSEIYKKFLS
jgi:hypothetical protein